MTLYARVVFPLPLDQSFLYAVPEPYRAAAKPGVRVVAPLGAKRRNGFIVALTSDPPAAGMRVKELAQVLDERPFRDERFLEFTRILSGEFHCPWGELLQASLPPSLAVRTKVVVRLTALGRERLENKALGPREKALAAVLAESVKGRSPLFLQRKTGGREVSGLIARMKKKGLLEVREQAVPSPRKPALGASEGPSQLGLDFPGPDPAEGPLASVERAVDSRRFGSFYLFGPDDSRRAAYRALIERASKVSGKILYLIPEIALTAGVVKGFEQDFGRGAVVFHGRMTDKQKENAWRHLKSGRAALVVGTRSALFIEADPLRLIIVDGEHEESYFQAESPSYDARRGAWLRARAAEAVIVFGSSRPTVEAFDEARRLGVLVELGREVRKTRLSWVEERRDGPLVSPALETKLRANLKKGRPAVLFLNRRGYASSPSCAGCGRVPKCPRCDIPFVYHKAEDRLVCHYCNFSTGVRRACSACGGHLALSRAVGTQALEEEIGRLFPGTRVARFDADTAAGAGERESILSEFRRGKIPILVGTQLLVHQPGMPQVGLVGILRPEALLGLSDYRAGQRTFQAVAAMMEVCRNDHDAEAVIQTASPAHYSIRAAAEGDYPAFFEREIAFRKLMNYPPSAALAELTLQGRDVRALAGNSRKLATLLKKHEPEPEVLGPVLAPFPRVRGVARVQFILKAKTREAIDQALRGSMPAVRLKKSVVFSYSPFRPQQALGDRPRSLR